MSVEDVSDSNFELKISQNKTVLVDFWAPWCGPCRALSPILKEISEKRSDISIFKINVDENPNLAMQHRVQSIPYMKVFKDGKEVSSKVGMSNVQDLIQWVDNS